MPLRVTSCRADSAEADHRRPGSGEPGYQGTTNLRLAEMPEAVHHAASAEVHQVLDQGARGRPVNERRRRRTVHKVIVVPINRSAQTVDHLGRRGCSGAESDGHRQACREVAVEVTKSMQLCGPVCRVLALVAPTRTTVPMSARHVGGRQRCSIRGATRAPRP